MGSRSSERDILPNESWGDAVYHLGAPLDLTSLERRLRDAKAIGVFTKLSLKNQVDDLLQQVKLFHRSSPR